METLSDVQGVADVYFPISVFATDPDWKDSFNLTQVMELTLRPCGALFYWIPTDRFSISTSDGNPLSVNDFEDLSWDDLSIQPEAVGQSFPYIDSLTDEFVWADPSTQQMRAWMRTNANPNFVMKAGTVSSPLSAGTYTVSVSDCRELEAEKFIKICSTEWLGVNQDYLAGIYLAVGSALFVGVMFYILVKPKRL